MNSVAGYGSVLLDQDDLTLSEDFGCLGNYATVFQAECMAIVNGIEKHSPNLTDNLTILTDNQAVVHALADNTTTSKTVKTLKECLNTLGSKRQVRVKWIRAHVGHYGNEIADQLAKRGSQTPTHGPEPLVPISKALLKSAVLDSMTKEWNNRWQNRTDARQTAIFYPKIDLKKSSCLWRLSKDSIGKAVRALSGHDFRTRHSAILEKTLPPSCRLCKMEEETASHLILHCPKLNHFRAQVFGSYTKDIVRTWKAKQVVAFISEPSISEMET